jgi:glycosyltransferase involved in cell wall biosynthesis
MRIAFVLTNPIESPGERYRAYQFIPYLEREGFSIETFSLFTSEDYASVPSMSGRRRFQLLTRRMAERSADLHKIRTFDVVFFYRQPTHWIPSRLRRYLKRADVPFVFDFDDAIFLSPPAPLSRASSYLRPKGEVDRLIADAAVTTVGNSYLRSFAQDYSGNIELIPTCIDLSQYEWRSAPIRDDFTIGWIGSRSTSEYLRLLDPAWTKISHSTSNARLRVVGGSYRHSCILVKEIPWRLGCDAEEISQFDVGIMPLPNNEWSRGKCGLKILQYMAVGVPVVASPVGVNKEMIQDGGNGFLAETADEWAEKIGLLATRPDLRERFAVEGRKTVERNYSLDRWAPVLGGILHDVSRTGKD